jgi:hypothetical protein
MVEAGVLAVDRLGGRPVGLEQLALEAPQLRVDLFAGDWVELTVEYPVAPEVWDRCTCRAAWSAAAWPSAPSSSTTDSQ